MRQFVDMFQRAGVVLSSFGLNFLALINFSTDDAAPITNPYVGEIGSLNIIADSSNLMSVASGKLAINGFAASADPRAYNSVSYDRVIGRTLLFKFNRLVAVNGINIGFHNVTTNIPSLNGFLIGSTVAARSNGASPDLSFALSTNTEYSFACLLKSSGALLFAKGGSITNWRLLLVIYAVTTTPLFSGLGMNGAGSGIINIDDWRIVDLPAPFNTDYGIALVNVTSFTQSLGAERAVNGSFAADTDWNKGAGWAIGAGVASATLSSAALSNTSAADAVINTMYECLVTVSGFVTGSVSMFSDLTGTGAASNPISADGARSFLIRSGSASPGKLGFSASAFTGNLDNVSVKAVTMNDQQTAPADGVYDFEYTLPASPVAGQRIEIRYRITDTLNYWVAAVIRNAGNTDWDFNLNSVSAGVSTNRISVTTIGATKRIQVRAIGTLHNCYTFSTTEVPTKRGGEINVSHNDTATGLNTLYSSAATPVRLTAYAVEHVMYNLLDRAMQPNAA